MAIKIKKETRGRKPAADPKRVVRVYIEDSLIKGNGGEENAKNLCLLFLRDLSEETIAIKKNMLNNF